MIFETCYLTPQLWCYHHQYLETLSKASDIEEPDRQAGLLGCATAKPQTRTDGPLFPAEEEAPDLLPCSVKFSRTLVAIECIPIGSRARRQR